MKPGTILIVAILALTAFGLRDRLGEVRAALPDNANLGAISVQELTVKQVIDGDTIQIKNGQRIRLLQVDAPQGGEEGECFGDEAKAWLQKQLPEGTKIQVKRDPDLPQIDADGRILRYVYRASDELFINQRLAQTGAGAPYFLDEKRGVHADNFEQLARKARKAPVGLWRVCEGTRYDPLRTVDSGPVIEPEPVIETSPAPAAPKAAK